MRAAFSRTLVRIAKNDPAVLLLTGDHGYALFDEFRDQCGSQYLNAGIAEQNMVGVAAGLARAGFRPFVYGLSAFVPVRVLEQIKLDVAHDGLPVVFIGDGAGFVYSHLGTSHQSTEDISCTRAIPQLSVLSPADRFELTACMTVAYEKRGPVYLRMGKSDKGDVHTAPIETVFNVSKPLCIRPGVEGGLAVFATGSMVRTAVDVVVGHFPDASLWSVPSIKPLGADEIGAICGRSKGVVVMEEHSVFGGLGSAVAEVVADFKPVRVLRIGVQDRFSTHCGTYEYLLREHGLDLNSVRSRVEAFIDTL